MKLAKTLGWRAMVTAVVATGALGTGAASSSASVHHRTGESTATSVKTVGIVDLVESDPLNQEVIKGVTAAASVKGWHVKVFDANGNADAANSAFRTYASEHVNMILDLAFPTTSVRAGLEAARAAHIPVGGWGSGLAPGILMTTVDDVGLPSANALLKAMGGPKGSGSVLALFYTGGQVCRERQAVLLHVLKQAPGVKVDVQNVTIQATAQGQQFTTAWLATHPAGSGRLAVWGCWDSPMYGAIAAIRAAGRHDVMTFSINGSPPALQDVKNGSLTNEVWENGYQEGVVVFNTTLAGIDTLAAHKPWTPKVVAVPGIDLTKKNIDSFLVAKHP
jgi:ribose transport system substrate-binding protein